MYLYLIPAKQAPDGIEPDFGRAQQQPFTWGGIYDEASHQYVISTERPLRMLTPLTEGQDVGFDYSALIPKNVPGRALPHETGAG
jgi:hypothetical protein